jgi:hypothetical protein
MLNLRGAACANTRSEIASCGGARRGPGSCSNRCHPRRNRSGVLSCRLTVVSGVSTSAPAPERHTSPHALALAITRSTRGALSTVAPRTEAHPGRVAAGTPPPWTPDHIPMPVDRDRQPRRGAASFNSRSAGLGRAHRVARQNAVSEAGSEALDLPLDHVRPIHDRPGRNVTIGIARVLAGRRPGVVELALLHEEHEGPLGMGPVRRDSASDARSRSTMSRALSSISRTTMGRTPSSRARRSKK